MKDDLEKCFEFILEVEKLKAVQRKTKPLGLERYENSAEHSWQVRFACADAGEICGSSRLILIRLLKMMILHDIGEIDADDTFFFDESGRASAKEKESVGDEKNFRDFAAKKSARNFSKSGTSLKTAERRKPNLPAPLIA